MRDDENTFSFLYTIEVECVSNNGNLIILYFLLDENGNIKRLNDKRNRYSNKTFEEICKLADEINEDTLCVNGKYCGGKISIIENRKSIIYERIVYERNDSDEIPLEKQS